MVEFDGTGPTADPDELAALEERLGRALPDSYRRFLLQHNGGSPTPDVVDVPSAPGTPTDIQVFFGLGRSVASSDLAWNLDLINERCPGRQVLPIACDSGGNLFCLDLAQSDRMPVLYCDLDTGAAAFFDVARDFDSFLCAIRS